MQTKTITRTVEKKHLASVMKSGSLDVLATPQMVAWMEEAACLCLTLKPEETSVGVAMNITHDAPSALGAEIEITAAIEEIQGRKITYSVQAKDGDTVIGKGTHIRFIVNSEKFINKVYKK